MATQGATRLAESGAFSVSSIPQNYTDTFVSLVTGVSRGFVVQDGWSSDSGTFGDLDQTEISEQVAYGAGTGCFTGGVGSNSGYLPGNSLTSDTHSWSVADLTSAGKLTAKQACMFKDNRTGSTDIAMTRSRLHDHPRKQGCGKRQVQDHHLEAGRGRYRERRYYQSR